jgi:hypothetical protein
MTRVCAVCQSWEPKDRNLPHVLKMLDQPCRLTVRSLGGGSGRWFGLTSYGDVK